MIALGTERSTLQCAKEFWFLTMAYEQSAVTYSSDCISFKESLRAKV